MPFIILPKKTSKDSTQLTVNTSTIEYIQAYYHEVNQEGVISIFAAGKQLIDYRFTKRVDDYNNLLNQLLQAVEASGLPKPKFL